MSRYTVVWDADLEDQFIDFWARGNSETRAILTAVANWVDANLSIDPERKGQVEPDGLRVVKVPTIAATITVVFEVFADDRMTRVLRLKFR
jgi:hypothetical protein